MIRGIFMLVLCAGIIAAGALAGGMRPTSGPVETIALQDKLGPSVETTVVTHTQVVRKHVPKSSSARSSVSVSTSTVTLGGGQNPSGN